MLQKFLKGLFISSIVTGEFQDKDDPTVEDTYYHTLQVDKKKCKLVLLDTSGYDLMAHLQSSNWLASSWLTQGDGFVFVYSVTSAYRYILIRELISKFRYDSNSG